MRSRSCNRSGALTGPPAYIGGLSLESAGSVPAAQSSSERTSMSRISWRPSNSRSSSKSNSNSIAKQHQVCSCDRGQRTRRNPHQEYIPYRTTPRGQKQAHASSQPRTLHALVPNPRESHTPPRVDGKRANDESTRFPPYCCYCRPDSKLQIPKFPKSTSPQNPTMRKRQLDLLHQETTPRTANLYIRLYPPSPFPSATPPRRHDVICCGRTFRHSHSHSHSARRIGNQGREEY